MERRHQGASEEQAIRDTDDPKEFFTGFRNSELYAASFAAFYEGKKLADDVTEEEKTSVFEESEKAKFALIEYAKTQCAFRCNPVFYSQEVQDAIRDYITHVHYQRYSLQHGVSQEELETIGVRRSMFHHELAQQLIKDDVAPNEKIGRALGRLILIQHGLDTYESAQQPDVTRIQKNA